MNASVLEQTWSAIALAGFVFSAWLVSDGWLDLASVRAAIKAVPPRARIWGPRWWIALSSVVANAALCLIWLGFGVIGVIAMNYPPPPPRLPDQQTSSMWVGWVLIGMEALLMAVQAWHLFVRGRVNRASAGVGADAAHHTLEAIDIGRQMGHVVASDLQRPVHVLDGIARDESLPAMIRADASVALADIDTLMSRVRDLHGSIKTQEMAP